MTDRYDQDMILGYVEGELDDSQREAFEATLAQDHELRNLVSQMKLDRENLRRLGVTPAPVGLIDQVMQAQERAELLGDPEAPEPLPLKMPVNPHKLRRVLAYSGIAAVLLLSAALVVPTLMPSGLLYRPAQFAINGSTTESTDIATSDAGSDLAGARIDEDSVYDQAATRPIMPLKADDSRTISKDAVATESTEEKSEQPKTTFADASPSQTEGLTVEQPASVGSSLALVEPGDPLDAVTPEADLIGGVDIAEDVTPADTALAESALAKTEPINEADEAEPTTATFAAVVDDRHERVPTAVHDPFMGYDNDDVSTVTSRTQLLVNASSPTLARRDIRDWAIANSVHIVEEPAADSIRRRALAAGGAGNPVTRSQLFVEIDEDQLPELLNHLNRLPSQRAELVTLADTDSPTREAGRAGERSANRSETRQARNAERTDIHDESRALANRPSEVGSNWPSVGIASGLAPTGSARDTSVKETEAQPAESTDDTSPPTEQLPDSEPGPAQPFDWSQLFDSLTIQPARPPSPLLQPEPRDRLRIEVIILQVADEVTVDETETD